jgi:host factor-I protein
MERDNSPNIQNDFFNQARKDKARVVVFLNSGKKLVGRIKSFDKFTVILDNGQGEQMVFKHAIATVSSIKTFGNYMNFEAASGKGKEAPEGEGAPQDGGAEPEGPSQNE